MTDPARKRSLAYNPEAAIVRDVHVPLVVGISHSTIWRLRLAGVFPAAIRLGPYSIGFRRRDLEAWLDGRPVNER